MLCKYLPHIIISIYFGHYFYFTLGYLESTSFNVFHLQNEKFLPQNLVKKTLLDCGILRSLRWSSSKNTTLGFEMDYRKYIAHNLSYHTMPNVQELQKHTLFMAVPLIFACSFVFGELPLFSMLEAPLFLNYLYCDITERIGAGLQKGIGDYKSS